MGPKPKAKSRKPKAQARPKASGGGEVPSADPGSTALEREVSGSPLANNLFTMKTLVLQWKLVVLQ